MTKAEIVPVTQEDRDATADIITHAEHMGLDDDDAEAVRDGIWDEDESDLGMLLQIVARHRLTAQSARPPVEQVDGLNPVVVAITEAAIMHLDADEDDTAQHAAFERALLPILAALTAQSARPPVEGADLSEHFPTGLRSKFHQIASTSEVIESPIQCECWCGETFVGTDEQEVRQLWAEHARAAIEASLPFRDGGWREAREQAAKYHDALADDAERSWKRARKEGLEFAHGGKNIAGQHRHHAAAIRALPDPPVGGA